ncbi:MAG TPA: hypothetical protein PLT68_11595 [Actinomycetota bacterium]|nr:hypothetical protein [Actinomycetota bacterium]
MQDDWPDLTDVEVRATALDRLDLHYEHRDALTVERGSWSLADYVRRFQVLQVVIGGEVVKGNLLAVGSDWVQLNSALVSLPLCDQIRPLGRGEGVPTSPVGFRQCLRQYTGRMPREVILAGGESIVVGLDWVGADFVHARVSGRPTLLPLVRVGAVLGSV